MNFNPLLADEILDGRNSHARFVHVKEKIAALARREEIGEARDARKRRCEKLLPAATDVVGRCVEFALGDEGARGRDVAAAGIAVERKMHQAARPQQREQDAPAGERIRHVMQYAACIDHVEAAVDRSEIENIRLRVVDA